MHDKKKIRLAFRKAVFTRAKYCCECCGVKGYDRQEAEGKGEALDSHHIIDRHDFENGGYVKENGISVCTNCHLKAEAYHCNQEPEPGYWPDELYDRIGSSYEKAVEADRLNC